MKLMKAIGSCIKAKVQEVKDQHGTVSMPIYDMRGSLLMIVEGCTLFNVSHDVFSAVHAVFRQRPLEVRAAMMYDPKPGERVARALWWRELLREALPPREAAEAMVRILEWRRQCRAKYGA